MPSTQSSSRWLGSRSALIAAILGPALLCGLIVCRLPREVFWITDGGNKFIQVQQLARFGAGGLSIAYPGRAIDPELRFFPFGGHHFQLVGGRVLSFYPPYFPLLTLPAYRSLGPAGLYLLPWLGFVLTLAGFAALLKNVGLAQWRAPATLGFALGTPLLFYGMTFWEHTPAVALSTAALLLLLRVSQSLMPAMGDEWSLLSPVRSSGGGATVRSRSFSFALAAGILLGLSTALREEGYALAIALALGILIAWRRTGPALAVISGWAAALTPVWWFQWRLYGTPLGLHAAAYGGLSGGAHGLARWAGEVGDLLFYLLRFHPDLRWNAALVLPFGLLLAWGLRRRDRPSGWVEPALLWGAAASTSLLVAGLLADPEPVFGTLWTQGLLPHTPLLVLVLARLRSLLGHPRASVRLLAWTCLLYAPIVALPLHRADVGILWGPRHFLPVYPLLFALALAALADLLAGSPGSEDFPATNSRRALAAAAGVLFLLGVAVEVQGVRLLALKKEATRRILQAVRAEPSRVVVTDAYWLPEELAALWFERAFLFVGSDDDYRELMARLARRGPAEVTMVLSRRYGALGPRSLLDLRARALAARPVATPGVGFLDVMVLRCRSR